MTRAIVIASGLLMGIVLTTGGSEAKLVRPPERGHRQSNDPVLVWNAIALQAMADDHTEIFGSPEQGARHTLHVRLPSCTPPASYLVRPDCGAELPSPAWLNWATSSRHRAGDRGMPRRPLARSSSTVSPNSRFTGFTRTASRRTARPLVF